MAAKTELTSDMDDEYTYATPERDHPYTSKIKRNENEAYEQSDDNSDIYDDVKVGTESNGDKPRYPSDQPSQAPVVLNIENRDPNNINEFVKVSWDDIIAEPQNIHSDQCVWTNSNKCYKGSSYWCYRLCTFICGLPLAFCWGITFALISFCHIWYVVPALKAFMIELTCIKECWEALVQTLFDPCYKSFALVCSRIKIKHQGEKLP